MDIYRICILISSISFFAYSFYYFTSPHMKEEFKRFGLEGLGLFTTACQFFGATGLLLGIQFNIVLSSASLGLALLMFCGLAVRIKSKDSLWVSIPALFYMFLNTYIFIMSLQ